MGNRYWVKRENYTPTAAQDALTVISAAGRRLRILQVLAGGVGVSSAPQGIAMSRSAAGTTPGGAITPSKAEHTDQPASTFTTATTWAVQPTPETNGMDVSFNALGGMGPWTAGPRVVPLEARNGECVSFRPVGGITTQLQQLSVLVEED